MFLTVTKWGGKILEERLKTAFKRIEALDELLADDLIFVNDINSYLENET